MTDIPYKYMQTAYVSDPVIYYVIDTKQRRGYVGQSTRGLTRLAEHIIGAYTTSSYKSGAATIIRDNTCANTFFRYFTGRDYFGVPETLKYFLGFKTKNTNFGH